MTSSVTGGQTTKIVIGQDDTLLDVFDRVRGAGDQPVELTIPNESSLFLTAAEFRTLRDVADHGRHEVTIKTPDPLRLQLAKLLGLEVTRMAPPAPAPAGLVPRSQAQSATARKEAAPANAANVAVSAAPAAKPEPRIDDTPQPETAVTPAVGDTAPAATAAAKPTAKVAKAKPVVAGPPVPDSLREPGAESGSAISENDADAHWPAEPVEHRPVPAAPRRLMDRVAAGLGGGRRQTAPDEVSGEPGADTTADEQATGDLAAATTETGAGDEEPDRIHWVGDRRRLSPRLLAGVAVAAVLLLIAASVVLPSAAVELELASLPINSELVFDVTRDGQPLDDQAAFVLTGEPVTLTIELAASVPTTGARAVPDGLASGSVRLANPTGSEQTVEAGTLLTTEDGVEFTVGEAVVVPAADPATGAAGQADAAIEAVNPGTGGNVETGQIGGRLANGVYYSNRAAATAGGTDREVRTVAQADLDGLQATVDEQLLAQAQSELRSDPATAGLTVVASSITVDASSDTFDHELDAEADQVAIQAERTVSMLAYDQAEASALLASELGEQLQALVPPGYSLGPVALGSEDVTALEGSPAGVRLRFDAGARATLALTEAQRSELAGQLAGKSEDEAAALLKSLPEVAEFAIEPGFRLFGSNLPPLAGRIEIDDGTGG